MAGAAAGVAATIKPSILLFLAGPALPAPARSPLAHGALVRRGHRSHRSCSSRSGSSVGSGQFPAFALEETRRCGRGFRLDKRARQVRLSRLGLVPPQHVQPARVRLQRPRAPVDSVRGRIRRRAAVAAARRPARRLVRRLLPSRERRRRPRSTAAASSAYLMPAYPAYFLLFASLPLLVPGVVRRIKRAARPAPPRPIGRRTLVVVGILLVAVPLVAIVAPQPISTRAPEAISINTILTPVDDAIRVTITPDGARRTVTWTHPDFGRPRSSTGVPHRVRRRTSTAARPGRRSAS